jgi:hypothetical protein
MKPMFKGPGAKRLKLEYDKSLSILLQFSFQIQLEPLRRGGGGRRSSRRRRTRRAYRRRAVQVVPIKPTLKAPGIKLLNLKYGKPLSHLAFRFNLRRYTAALDAEPVLRAAAPTNEVEGETFALQYEVWTSKFRSPRHPPRFGPLFLELHSVLEGCVAFRNVL